jgi:hypothetical protein
MVIEHSLVRGSYCCCGLGDRHLRSRSCPGWNLRPIWRKVAASLLKSGRSRLVVGHNPDRAWPALLLRLDGGEAIRFSKGC